MKTLSSLFVLFSALHASGADLEAIRQEHQLPALTAGSLVRDQAPTITTVGTRKHGDATAATREDRWHLGSNTKAITATLGAVLIEKGVMSWETTIAQVFSDWPVHTRYRNITLKELFAHRAGVHANIAAFAGGSYFARMMDPSANQIAIRDEFVRATLTTAPETDGRQFVYSNSGYMVAAQMMSRLTGKNWETLVTENVFQPLGMASCGFGAPGAGPFIAPRQPWPHSVRAGMVVPVSPSERGADNPQALGAAGIVHCSIQDWLKFAKAHIDGFNGVDTPLLTAKGFELLHRDYQGQGYTSGGWLIETRDGRTVLGHNGSNTMNFAILVLDPATRSAYAAATNRGDATAEAGTQKAMLAIGSPNVCMQGFCLLGR